MSSVNALQQADFGDVSIDQSFIRTHHLNSAIGSTASNRLSNGSSTEDIWSQILLSVRTARSTPVFPLIILGEPQSGKTSLVRGLAEGCHRGHIETGGEDDAIDEDEGGEARVPSVGTSSSSHIVQSVRVGEDVQNDSRQQQQVQRGRRDMGLAYGYCDVPDDEGEDILARLSVYTLSSSNDALLPLLSTALGSLDVARGGLAPGKKESAPRPWASLKALRDSLFLIVLDWERPQAFLEELRTWIAVIKMTVEDAACTADDDRQRRAQEVMLEEMKDAIEAYLRSYTPPGGAGVPSSFDFEPSQQRRGPSTDESKLKTAEADGSSMAAPTIVPVSAPSGISHGRGDILPLDEGTLDDNLGITLVVVLTKSDTVGELERDRGFKEEQFDYILQVLRTICLKYGAALFSTAHNRQSSFGVLRQYILHRLFSSRAANAESTTSTRVAFNHAPATIERDVLLVPTGWDSWGKIVALREGFSPQATAQGWEWDAEIERRRRVRHLTKDHLDEVERELQQEQGEVKGSGSACRLWEDVVGDWKARNNTSMNTGRIAPPDNQAFLAQHFATLQKETALSSSSAVNGASDPRAKFARATGASSATATGKDNNGDSAHGGARSIVGPMQSSSMSGPAVERAIGLAQREDSSPDGGLGISSASSSEQQSSKDAKAARRRDSREHQLASSQRRTSTGLSRPQSPLVPPGAINAFGAGVTSPSSPGTPSAAATTKQSEVLQSFFQDLLRGKSSTGPSGGGTGSIGSAGSSTSGAARQSGGPRS